MNGFTFGIKTLDVNEQCISDKHEGRLKMKKDLVEILCCPTCKGDLELTIKKKDNEEIIEGKLTCKGCNCVYPIKEGIPNLLPQKD